MKLVLHATEVIDGKTYKTKGYSVDAKNMRAPSDAEEVIEKFLIHANDNFERVRKHRKRSPRNR